MTNSPRDARTPAHSAWFIVRLVLMAALFLVFVYVPSVHALPLGWFTVSFVAAIVLVNLAVTGVARWLGSGKCTIDTIFDEELGH